MALNTFECNSLTPVHFKELTEYKLSILSFWELYVRWCHDDTDDDDAVICTDLIPGSCVDVDAYNTNSWCAVCADIASLVCCFDVAAPGNLHDSNIRAFLRKVI